MRARVRTRPGDVCWACRVAVPWGRVCIVTFRDGDHRGARLRAIALPLSPEGQWFRSRLDFSTMTDFTRVWHRAWVVRDCSHPGFGPPAGGHGATVQRGCSDRGRRVPVLRRTGIRVTSSTLTHASLLPFRPTRTCLSDHRRQQLHRSADRHHRRGSNPPRTRPVHESRALTRRGASRRNRCRGLWRFGVTVSGLRHLCSGRRGVVRFRSRC